MPDSERNGAVEELESLRTLAEVEEGSCGLETVESRIEVETNSTGMKVAGYMSLTKRQQDVVGAAVVEAVGNGGSCGCGGGSCLRENLLMMLQEFEFGSQMVAAQNSVVDYCWSEGMKEVEARWKARYESRSLNVDVMVVDDQTTR